MSKANGEHGKSEPGAVQVERELVQARAEMRQRNLRKRGGTHIKCKRCDQLLAISYGDHLDCFAFTLWHRAKLVCEACGFETRWGPGKGTAFNADNTTPEEKSEQPIDVPMPKEYIGNADREE
jgi:hypothetical protein